MAGSYLCPNTPLNVHLTFPFKETAPSFTGSATGGRVSSVKGKFLRLEEADLEDGWIHQHCLH